MRTANQKKIISKLYCNWLGHNYAISKKITAHVMEYKCSNCNHELTTNGKGILVDLSPKHLEINAVLSRIHKKKMTRMARNVMTPVVYRMTS